MVHVNPYGCGLDQTPFCGLVGKKFTSRLGSARQPVYKHSHNQRGCHAGEYHQPLASLNLPTSIGPS
jgi:hypothetical protein